MPIDLTVFKKGIPHLLDGTSISASSRRVHRELERVAREATVGACEQGLTSERLIWIVQEKFIAEFLIPIEIHAIEIAKKHRSHIPFRVIAQRRLTSFASYSSP